MEQQEENFIVGTSFVTTPWLGVTTPAIPMRELEQIKII
jgi:hypothetical protein